MLIARSSGIPSIHTSVALFRILRISLSHPCIPWPRCSTCCRGRQSHRQRILPNHPRWYKWTSLLVSIRRHNLPTTSTYAYSIQDRICLCTHGDGESSLWWRCQCQRLNNPIAHRFSSHDHGHLLPCPAARQLEEPTSVRCHAYASVNSHMPNLLLEFVCAIPQRRSKARSTFPPSTGSVSIYRVSASTGGSSMTRSLHWDGCSLSHIHEPRSFELRIWVRIHLFLPILLPEPALDLPWLRSCSSRPL